MNRPFGSSLFGRISDTESIRRCDRCGDTIIGVGCLATNKDGKQGRYDQACSNVVIADRRAAQPVGTLINFDEQTDGAEVRIVKTFRNGKLRAEFVKSHGRFYGLQLITIRAEQFAPAQKEPNYMKNLVTQIAGTVSGRISDAQNEREAAAGLVLAAELAANTHAVARLHLEIRKARYFVLVIHGGESTVLLGGTTNGFDTLEQANDRARETRRERDTFRKEYDSMFRVTISETGALSVLSFPPDFFDDDE